MKRAVWRYGWERFAALARKVIFRLQRLDASGIYGERLSTQDVMG